MDEEISIINTKTRNEKIKNFLINNKKTLIIIFTSIILLIFAYLGYGEIQERKINKLAEKYNNILINFDTDNKDNFKNQLIEIIKEKKFNIFTTCTILYY